MTLSIFSGAGGLDIGFHDAGFEILARVEIDSDCCETLRRNTGDGLYFHSGETIEIDIRAFSPTFSKGIDFIIGGPPCQTFSAAGRRANGVMGLDDSRGTLFEEYIRVLKILRPKGFLFENVYGITGAQQGKAWSAIKSAFGSAGYKIFYRILDSADYGVPQHRERLFIIGVKNGVFLFPRPTHGPDSPDNFPFYNAGLAIQSLAPPKEERHIQGRFGKLLDDIPPGLNYSFYTEEMGHPQPIFAWRSKFSDFMYKADPDSPVRTIKAQGGQYTGPFHWSCRHFTIPEFKRLQTFPDDYKLCGNFQSQMKQIGNSVPPQIGRVLALAVREQIFGEPPILNLDYLNEREKLGFRKRKRLLTKEYREKARAAIAAIPVPSEPNCTKNKAFWVRLTSDFKLKKARSQTAQYKIEITNEEKLKIYITGANERTL